MDISGLFGLYFFHPQKIVATNLHRKKLIFCNLGNRKLTFGRSGDKKPDTDRKQTNTIHSRKEPDQCGAEITDGS